MGYKGRKHGSNYSVNRSVRSVQAARSLKAQNMDTRLRAPLAKTAEQWKNNPNHFDLNGIDTPPEDPFKFKKDYGKVKEYSLNGRDYLIGEEIGVPFESNIKYAKKIATILDSIPKEDTENIKFVVIDPDYNNAGQLIRSHLPSHIYDAIGKKAARAFIRKHDTHISNPDEKQIIYGLAFGSEIWNEAKNNLPHLVKHEVGHLKRWNIPLEERKKYDLAYQKAAEAFLKLDDPDVKRRIERVERINSPEITGVEGLAIMQIHGLSNINFRKDLFDKYGIPSIYSMSQPSEFFAEMYSFGLIPKEYE